MRGVTDHIGQGLARSTASWPLLVVTMVIRFAMVVVLVVGFLIALIPIAIAGALTLSQLKVSTSDEFIEKVLLAHPLVVLYVIMVVVLLTLPVMIIHSFSEAGKAAVLLERGPSEPRPSFRAAGTQFDLQRWWRACVAHWWAVFLMMNIIWSIALLLLLVPIIVVAVFGLLALRDGSSFTLTCAAAAAMIPVVFMISFVAHVWQQLAILERVRSGALPLAATKRAWRLIVAEPLQTIGTGLAMVLIAIGAMVTVIALQAGTNSLSSFPGLAIMFFPLQILVTVGQSVLSALLSVWTTAAFASLLISREGSIELNERTAVSES